MYLVQVQQAIATLKQRERELSGRLGHAAIRHHASVRHFSGAMEDMLAQKFGITPVDLHAHHT
jgi:hypothetical protein